MAREERFRSSVGWLFVAAMLIVGGALVVTQARALNPGGLILGFAFGWLLWICIDTAYVVRDDGMLVRYGPSRRWVDAKLIERVRPSRSVLSGPALSFDRLEVSGGFGAVIVSPKDRDGFIRALQRVAPQLRIE